MQQVAIQAELRVKFGKGASHQIREQGKIPAEFYGKGQENIHLIIHPKELEKAISGELGTNTLIELQIKDKGTHPVLLKDYQAHSIKRHFTHADFIHVDLAKKIKVSVPIHLVGKAAGIKEGGIVEQVARELEVFCLPNNIPKEINADVTHLKIGQNLHLHEIKLPEGITPVSKLDTTIALVIMPKEEVVAEPQAVMAEPEVTTAKKVEGEEGAVASEGGDKKDKTPKEKAPVKEKAAEGAKKAPGK